MGEKVICSWSGGKDSTLALYKALKEDKYDVLCLLTTINKDLKRIAMHGIRETLLDQQADSLGIPLEKVRVSDKSPNNEYESKMEEIYLKYKAQGVHKVIYGDIFLEDLRTYRQSHLKRIGMTGKYPLWKRDTKELIHEFLSLGFKTMTCCVETRWLDQDKVGQLIDQSFIDQLPSDVDPCGENGEFHSFCYDGPLFKKKISFTIGEKTYKEVTHGLTKGFWYCDLIGNG